MPVETEPRVHNEETTAQIDPIPTYGESLRRSCYPSYLAAERVYGCLDERKDRSRVDRLHWCRSTAWFCRHTESGEVRVASNSCHLRWCPVCAQSRRNYIAHEVAEWTSSASHPKFLTLTLKHTSAPLDHQVTCLYNFFRELRRRKEFRRCVKGGIWFFQIKKSKSDSLWHPHLHCLVEGLYLAKRKLHKMWCQVTFGSFIADIRAVHDPQAAANDAARYASSPGTLVDLPIQDACELVDAMHGRRICGTWGTGRTVSLRPAKEKDPGTWQNVGSWFYVMGSREVNPNAKAIINAWRDKKPLEKGIVCVDYEDFIEEELKSHWDQMTFDEVYKTERSPP